MRGVFARPLALTKNESGPKLFDIFTGELRIRFVRSGQMTLNRRLETAFIERLHQNLLSPQPSRFPFRPAVFGGAGHDDGKVRTQPAHPAKDVQEIVVSARQIQQQQVGHTARLNALDRIPRAQGGFYIPGVGLRDRPQRAKNRDSLLTTSKRAVSVMFFATGQWLLLVSPELEMRKLSDSRRFVWNPTRVDVGVLTFKFNFVS